MSHLGQGQGAAQVSEVGWERRTGGAPVRVLRDRASGRKWRVWVADTRGVPGARGDRCLLYDTGEWVRRVWRVPDDWARMAPAALVALAEAAAEAAAEAVEAPAAPRRASHDAWRWAQSA
jgi:hypothetical protein